MTRTLFARLFSTKTLIYVGITVASLHFLGLAHAQGATASTNPPAYGGAWAATHARSNGLDESQVPVRAAKAARAAAPATTDSNPRVSSPRTGG